MCTRPTLGYRIVIAALILNSYAAMSQNHKQGTDQCGYAGTQATAQFVAHEIQPNAGNPAPEWSAAPQVSFCSDWQGRNPDPKHETKVRLLWTSKTLYLRFECSFRRLYTFDDSDPNGRRDHLWDRDVAEVFLQPDASREHFYKEIEIAPNGMWIDLDISPGPLKDLKSGMQRSVSVDERRSIWAAEIAIPIKALTPEFDPALTWRVNFYRIEGNVEPRTYLAWSPTNTPKPNFHVPSAFGRLRFSGSAER